MKYCMHCMQPLMETDAECPFCGRTIQVDYSPHHIIPGTILNNRYLIGKVIGQGGFGITYIGRDLTLNVKIALKEYYPNGYVSRSNNVSLAVDFNASESEKVFFEKGRERFLGEAQVLAKFRNEQGIVSVSDFFEDNNTAYIVMEYLEGEDLKEYLKEKGTIPAEKIIQLMMPIMNTLEKIHGQGFIHRDISPDNIRVVENGLKLMDFGAARVISSSAKKSLSVMLKPGYAPYEQYYSDGEQGAWTDVYALCATLYRCITGITPPEAPGRTRNDSIKTPSALGIDIASAIEKSILKGLSVWPEDRFKTITELLQGLQGKLVEEEGNAETVHIPMGSGEGWEGKPVENDSTNESGSIDQKDVGVEGKSQNATEKKEKEGLIESLHEPKKRRIIWILLLILVLLGIGTGILVFVFSGNQTEGGDKKTSLSMTSTPVPTATSTPESPTTSTPEPPTTSTPESPTTSTPEPPTTSTPESPTTSTPEPPTTSTPESPTTSTPEPPTTSTPESPTTSTPEPPTTSTPESPATSTPEPPTTSAPVSHVHDYSWKTRITKQATCVSTGEEKNLCSCGEYLLETIPEIEHSEVTVSGKAATCTITGLTDGKKCSVCGTVTVNQTPIAAQGHSEVTVLGKAATCTTAGLTDGKKCSVCGIVTVNQTPIAAQGHSEVTVLGKAATCTTTGLTDGKKCSVCGTVTVNQTPIAAQGHSEVTVSGKAATCTTTGLTDGKKCSVCGTMTIAQGHIAAKGHAYDGDGDLECNSCGYSRGYWGEWVGNGTAAVTETVTRQVKTKPVSVTVYKYRYSRYVWYNSSGVYCSSKFPPSGYKEGTVKKGSKTYCINYSSVYDTAIPVVYKYYDGVAVSTYDCGGIIYYTEIVDEIITSETHYFYSDVIYY